MRERDAVGDGGAREDGLDQPHVDRAREAHAVGRAAEAREDLALRLRQRPAAEARARVDRPERLERVGLRVPGALEALDDGEDHEQRVHRLPHALDGVDAGPEAQAREVALEDRLVRGHLLEAGERGLRRSLEAVDAVEKEERPPVRDQVRDGVRAELERLHPESPPSTTRPCPVR
ncbi:MAG: hypothetical protein M5U28_05855 [Sandaracinaceae bacterium]|nr:hypothetical protein [Sandaracinaceae bacterium]